MASFITAGNATNGLQVSSDNTGILQLKSGTGAGTTAITVDASQNTTFTGQIRGNAASTPPTFADSAGTQIGTLCRAWVSFNGISGASPVIQASFNVSSVTRNATGDYTLSFTNSLADANYSVVGTCATANSYPSYSGVRVPYVSAPAGTITTSAIRVATGAGATSTGTGAAVDCTYVYLAVFR